MPHNVPPTRGWSLALAPKIHSSAVPCWSWPGSLRWAAVKLRPRP